MSKKKEDVVANEEVKETENEGIEPTDVNNINVVNEEVKESSEKPAKYSSTYKFRAKSKGSFKSTIIINGQKYDITCKDGIISTTSGVVASELRKKYSEAK